MISDLKLNKEQLAAIEYGNGPLLIIAGAGTGKTTVITERIKYLIFSKKVKPSNILALTFTEKAAKEMIDRVDEVMPYGYTDMWISTFHSFCDRILRDKSLEIGLDPRYKLMTQAEDIQFIRNNLFKFDLNYFRPLGNPTKFVEGMLQHFSRLQDEDVDPSRYLAWAKSEARNSKRKKEEKAKWLELAKAYKTYDELKTKESVLDFGDLIVKTLKLFRDRPNVLKQYQKQFKHILVDEFQDTNVSQYELLKLLAKPKLAANITVVGDDSQSIYKFRGAAVSNILSFKKDYKKTKTVTLLSNYRSTQKILDAAYRLIKFNNPDTLEAQLGISKKLVSEVSKNGEDIAFIHTDRVENEAEMVAKEIGKLVKKSPADGGYHYQDVAILVRANNHSEPIMRALSRHGIPYQFLGPGRLFKQPEIVDLISYLKVLNNFEDSVSFYRLLCLDYFKISGRELAVLGSYSKRYHVSLFEAAEKMGSKKVKKLVNLIKGSFKLIRKETAGQLLYNFLADTGLMRALLDPKSMEAEKKAKNVSKFFDKLKTYEIDHEDATIPAVVDWLDLSFELGESPLAADIDWTDINAVNILTVHSAKGLEFPVVFLVNMVSQRFPTIQRREQIPIPDELVKEVLPQGDYHLEEERRLAYVGMTRAKKRLYFTAADYYGEGKREKRLSPFIFEALGDSVKAEQSTVNSEQLSFLSYQPHRPAPSTVHGSQICIDYLSYSQIETFKICPLHYKLKYIYKIPTPPSASASFGTSIHLTLKEFYQEVINTKKADDKLIFKLLQKNWINEGYSDRIHERKFFEKGKDYLRGFLKEGFNPKNLPVSLEQPFIVPLGRGLRIGGKIDRIDALPGEMIEVIDYKTGATIPTQKEVDMNLQLSLYALAATGIPEAPFGKKPEKIKLSLYFLDTQEKISTTKTAKQLKEAVNEIFKVKDEIEKSDFSCSGHMFCQKDCEYSLLCKSEV